VRSSQATWWSSAIPATSYTTKSTAVRVENGPPNRLSAQAFVASAVVGELIAGIICEWRIPQGAGFTQNRFQNPSMHLVHIVYAVHMHTIKLADAIYQRLLKRAATFDDTAEDVVRRLLDQTEDTNAPELESPEVDRQRRSRATPGSILPEREYWRPILSIIAEAGGSASANDVIEAIGKRMKDAFTPRDLDVLKLGEVRWRNRARFARLRMKEQGLLSDTSHRGIWEITETGRQYIASA
jgi:hypothetical protein